MTTTPGQGSGLPLAAAVLAAALLTAGCGARPSTTARAVGPAPTSGATATATPTRAPSQPGAPAFPAYAAEATGATVAVHAAPDGPVRRTLNNPLPSGAPLTFLLARRSGEWLQVYLPTRPNGSTGWVRAGDVSIAGLPHRLDVLQRSHQLRLYRFGKLSKTYPIAVGKADTPTPGGTFYLKELIRPTNGGGLYGPYAFGLSGFSDALSSFGGGEAVIGLHGTNDESSIGRDVSHGCIRLHNADITALAKLLPLGTPVRILA
ncbi:MAG: L,D-transpeptidase family protein [Mycobacteriales bacterium]